MQRNAEEVLDAFDFEKVHKAMHAVGWTYFDSQETPSVARLRKTARGLIDHLKEGKCEETSSGGFTARLVPAELSDKKIVQLQFVLTDMDEERVEF